MVTIFSFSSIVIVADAFIPAFIFSSFGTVISTVYLATPPLAEAVLLTFVTVPSKVLSSIASKVTSAVCPCVTELMSSSSTLTESSIEVSPEMVKAVVSVLYWESVSVCVSTSSDCRVSEVCVSVLFPPEAFPLPVIPVDVLPPPWVFPVFCVVSVSLS